MIKEKGEDLMEIRVLRYFLAIAREGSIIGASDLLHVTSPTLSRQIKELEEELGQKLFVRGSHSMTLTAEGMIFRKMCIRDSPRDDSLHASQVYPQVVGTVAYDRAGF